MTLTFNNYYGLKFCVKDSNAARPDSNKSELFAKKHLRERDEAIVRPIYLITP